MTNQTKKEHAALAPCKHEYGQYRPNPDTRLYCADCGIELDIITRQAKQALAKVGA